MPADRPRSPRPGGTTRRPGPGAGRPPRPGSRGARSGDGGAPRTGGTPPRAPAVRVRTVLAATTAGRAARRGAPAVRAPDGARSDDRRGAGSRASGRPTRSYGDSAEAGRPTAGRARRCAAADLDRDGRGSTGWPVAPAPRAVASATDRRAGGGASARRSGTAPTARDPPAGGVSVPMVPRGPLETTSAPDRAVAMTGPGRAVVIRASRGVMIAARRTAVAVGCRRARLPSR